MTKIDQFRSTHGIDCRDPQPGECSCGAVSPLSTVYDDGGDEPASVFDACNHALAYARETLLMLPQPTMPLDRQAFNRMMKYLNDALELAAATGVEPRRPICGGNNYCTNTAAAAISALDLAWAAVNAQGGPVERATNSYDHGIIDGIGKALEEIEKLGGSDPLVKTEQVKARLKGE